MITNRRNYIFLHFILMDVPVNLLMDVPVNLFPERFGGGGLDAHKFIGERFRQ
jgi:hypothetical protein